MGIDFWRGANFGGLESFFLGFGFILNNFFVKFLVGVIEKYYVCGVEIVVTQKDIDNGERGSGAHCPISLALQRENIDGLVGQWAIYLRDYSKRIAWLPEDARRFVVDFEDGKLVKSFSFSIELL